MSSKRFKKLPEKTSDLNAETIENYCGLHLYKYLWNLAETQWTAPAPRLERKQAQTLTASLANLLIRTDGDEDDDQDYFENYD